MSFPTTEPEIIALWNQMLEGYFWHAADFPHIPGIIRMRLFTRGRSYRLARRDMVQAFAALRIATKAKNNSLQELKKIMKQSLQKSEVDVAANPEKLKLIGWAPKANRQPAQLLTQPTNLQITANEDRIVKLKWDRPEDDQRVRNYCIERRQLALRSPDFVEAKDGQSGDGISEWTIANISYNTQTTLRNQPSGIQLEYRIRAANNAGTGPSSNTVTIVL
jgi:hypothetical protein